MTVNAKSGKDKPHQSKQIPDCFLPLPFLESFGKALQPKNKIYLSENHQPHILGLAVNVMFVLMHIMSKADTS